MSPLHCKSHHRLHCRIDNSHNQYNCQMYTMDNNSSRFDNSLARHMNQLYKSDCRRLSPSNNSLETHKLQLNTSHCMMKH